MDTEGQTADLHDWNAKSIPSPSPLSSSPPLLSPLLVLHSLLVLLSPRPPAHFPSPLSARSLTPAAWSFAAFRACVIGSVGAHSSCAFRTKGKSNLFNVPLTISNRSPPFLVPSLRVKLRWNACDATGIAGFRYSNDGGQDPRFYIFLRRSCVVSSLLAGLQLRQQNRCMKGSTKTTTTTGSSHMGGACSVLLFERAPTSLSRLQTKRPTDRPTERTRGGGQGNDGLRATAIGCRKSASSIDWKAGSRRRGGAAVTTSTLTIAGIREPVG
ncbi:hypothetical protein GALMADRAFT_138051 [Galerina marginata CBS 339.88]|uniref:Uncharacterized protein n=1 Tax=Galerina marginata (strain CBS 339.88) TaxID=685588 RepID=A0A067T3Y9_GALM3|nr:hypothetical protein GALMADRAFT_138051 [Galerina marginata CBS 339.88]